jgi:beta-galactosidase GanA
VVDKKILGIVAGIVIVVAIIGVSLSQNDSPQVVTQNKNEKIGLVINTPNSSVSLRDLEDIYSEASSTGIGRSNVYLFWNLIEPEKGEFDWQQSDILMGLDQKEK